MIRVVLAVLVTGALVATTAPAVDAAREDHRTTLARGEATRLASIATQFAAANDPAPPGFSGPTRRVTLRLPPGREWVVETTPRGRLTLGDGTTRHPVTGEAVFASGARVVLPAGVSHLRLTLCVADGRVTVAIARWRPRLPHPGWAC